MVCVLATSVLATGNARADSDPGDHLLGILLGISGGGDLAVNHDLAPNGLATIEGGYRFAPIDRAFGLSLAPTFLGVSLARGASRNSFAFAVPLLFSINFTLGPGLFRAAGGPFVAFTQVTSIDAFSTTQDRSVGWGVEGFAAYLWKLPFGAVGLQLTYRLLPYVVAHTAHNADLLSGEVAFLVGL